MVFGRAFVTFYQLELCRPYQSHLVSYMCAATFNKQVIKQELFEQIVDMRCVLLLHLDLCIYMDYI